MCHSKWVSARRDFLIATLVSDCMEKESVYKKGDPTTANAEEVYLEE